MSCYNHLEQIAVGIRDESNASPGLVAELYQRGESTWVKS